MVFLGVKVGRTLIFQYYTWARTIFGGFKTLNFNSFWGFHEKKINLFYWVGGYGEIVDIFWGQLQIGLFWGSFMYILGLFKTKVQNVNVFGGSQNFKCVLGFFLFFCGGGGGLIFLFLGVGLNSRC